ncbi:MAG: hypothetical protein RLZZ505_445 [Verrucomicrobiota bacterium]|jgi:ADP-ribosylglycohydrolase
MFGAIVGDIAGSTFERHNFKFECCHIFEEGSQFTDDTVLTIATADHFIYGEPYSTVYRKYGRNYPNAGYGASFRNWLKSETPEPYNSWGNGSAMRVSPIAWVGEELDWVLNEAKASAEVTHNHPSGMKGAQAIAACVFLARKGAAKESIRQHVEENFGYNLSRTLAEIRPGYMFDVSCDGSVPPAITAFLESSTFENSIRKAISIGGDSDTIASMTGAIAHAFYGEIPGWMTEYCFQALDIAQRHILNDFWAKYPPNKK